MFTLTDDRVTFVPPIVEQRVHDLAIAAREPFTKEASRPPERRG